MLLQRSNLLRVILLLLPLMYAVVAAAAFARDRTKSRLSFESVSTLTLGAAQFLLFTAVCGLAAMATLDGLKRLLPLRGAFHSSELMRRDSGGLLMEYMAAPSHTGFAWSTSRHSMQRARFDIPLEQLCAQVSAAFDKALGRLGNATANELDFRIVRPFMTANPEMWRDLQRRTWGPSGDAYTVSDPDLAAGLADARVGMEQWLDAFQAVVGNRWRWLLRFSASVLAMVIASMALVVFPLSVTQSVGLLVTSFIFGGFFAGFWRDLASLAERRRT